MAILSLLIIFWRFRSTFWYSISAAGIFCSVHAFLRDASMHKDMDDAVAMQGDLDEDSFLNPAQVSAV